MKRKLDLFKQELAGREQKRLATQQKLDALNIQRDQLTDQIDKAISADDLVSAERMIRERNELNVSVELHTLTLANLSKNALDREKVSEAYREELSDLEKQITSQVRKANQAKQDLINAACEIKRLRGSAQGVRWEYLQLIDIDNDPDFKRASAKFPWQEIAVDGFPFVSSPYYLPDGLKREMSQEQISGADFR